MATLKRCIFVVGQLWLVTIGFVAAGYDNAADGWVAPGCFQQQIGATNIGFKRRHWRPVGNRNDRLGSQVEDNINFVFRQRSL